MSMAHIQVHTRINQTLAASVHCMNCFWPGFDVCLENLDYRFDGLVF